MRAYVLTSTCMFSCASVTACTRARAYICARETRRPAGTLPHRLTGRDGANKGLHCSRAIISMDMELGWEKCACSPGHSCLSQGCAPWDRGCGKDMHLSAITSSANCLPLPFLTCFDSSEKGGPWVQRGGRSDCDLQRGTLIPRTPTEQH